MERFDVRAADLRVINSATKYPSIPTYHALDPRNGTLRDEVTAFTGDVIGTEKVDGTNSRIVQLPDGTWLLGSREELLYAEGDLIGNPSQGIVEALKPVAARLPALAEGDLMRAYYLELYGGKIGARAKQYTADGRSVGWRLFDVAVVDYAEVARRSPEQISRWRDEGGQQYSDEADLAELAAAAGLELTPRLFTLGAADLPSGIAGTKEFLDLRAPSSRCVLDAAAAGGAEGIVLRTPDRSVIAKARFQDYERTLRRRPGR